MRPGARGALALALGVLGLAASGEAVHYGEGATGFAAIPAVLVLLGISAVTLWRARRKNRWRYPRRVALGVAGFLTLVFVVAPAGVSYVSVHVARDAVPAPNLGAAHENVTLETSDGLTLKGWYVPSRNGAAVIAFPGRKGPQPHARMLIRHGYGMLLLDRRGEGESEGDPNPRGWGGTRDLKAVASEGAGIRSVSETLDMPRVEKWLVVYSGHGQGGEIELNPVFHRRAGASSTLWEIPGAGHVGGIRAQPKEYERRVVFFDAALR